MTARRFNQVQQCKSGAFRTAALPLRMDGCSSAAAL
jgi:hypothetical protein